MTMNDSPTLRQFSDGLAAAVARAGAATVQVDARRRFPATGVVWADGLVVTADHVIENEDAITVGLPDGSTTSAQLVGRDPGSDLALLRIEGASVGAAVLAADGSPKVGHLVLAVGRPSRRGIEASLGTVSAIGGPWRTRRGSRIEGYLRTDTTFFPGFSGGPLVNAEGEVIGVNISLPRGGITIDAKSVSTVVELLRTHGRVRRAYLGIASQQVRLPEALAGEFGEQRSGLLIVNVEPNTPAAAAGLLVGDILAMIEGAPVRDAEELRDALGPERVGATVHMALVRAGAKHEASVTLGERA
jgi:S1-C subfamily serine protease